jgi:hypothetical protein
VTAARRVAALLALTLCVLAAHWPAGRVDFVYDDEGFIVANPAAHSVAAAARAALRPFPPDQPGRGLYRPVTALSYGLDATLWRGSARGFAITNVALYLAAVLLAWQFFANQLPAGRGSFLAALLFAVHPVHTEAVDAIAGRSELLALLFALLAIRAYVQAAPAPATRGGPQATAPGGSAWRPALLSALAYALACGSKETAVVLPAALALLGAVRLLEERAGRDRWLRGARALLPHLFVLAAYLGARLLALGGLVPTRTTLGGVDLAGRVLTAGAVFLEYLRLLLFPLTLQVDGYYLARVGIVRAPAAAAGVGLALLALLLLAAGALAVRLGRRSAAANAPAAGPGVEGALLGGLGIFFLFLLPVSHVIPMGALMAERFLLLPSLGFVLAGAAAAVLLWQRLPPRLWGMRTTAPRRAGALLLVVLVLLGIWRSRVRAQEWRDAVRLWRSADRMIPGSVLVKTNLAAELLVRGDLAAAEALLLAALELRPGDPKASFNLALVAERTGDLARAGALLEELRWRNPADAAVLVELALVEARRANAERAHALLEQARPLAAGRADLEQRILALQRTLGN